MKEKEWYIIILGLFMLMGCTHEKGDPAPGSSFVLRGGGDVVRGDK